HDVCILRWRPDSGKRAMTLRCVGWAWPTIFECRVSNGGPCPPYVSTREVMTLSAYARYRSSFGLGRDQHGFGEPQSERRGARTHGRYPERGLRSQRLIEHGEPADAYPLLDRIPIRKKRCAPRLGSQAGGAAGGTGPCLVVGSADAVGCEETCQLPRCVGWAWPTIFECRVSNGGPCPPYLERS